MPAGTKVPLLVKDANAAVLARLERHHEHFLRLARVEDITPVEAVPSGGVSAVVEGTTLILRLGEVVDLGREKARLAKELGRLDAELAKTFWLLLQHPSSKNSSNSRAAPARGTGLGP